MSKRLIDAAPLGFRGVGFAKWPKGNEADRHGDRLVTGPAADAPIPWRPGDVMPAVEIRIYGGTSKADAIRLIRKLFYVVEREPGFDAPKPPERTPCTVIE